MITWIIGQSGAGKSTLSSSLGSFYTGWIRLDGDSIREMWPEIGFSRDDRCENNVRIAKLAKMLERQGFNVLVSVICPYRELRSIVRKITACKFIYIEGGVEKNEYPFEHPNI